MQVIRRAAMSARRASSAQRHTTAGIAVVVQVLSAARTGRPCRRVVAVIRGRRPRDERDL
jgi:hypothetical protein